MASKTIAPIECMTMAQAGRAADRFSDKCRKDGIILPKDQVQIVLEEEGDEVAEEMFGVLRKRVEARLILIHRDPVIVTLATDHDPDLFYRDRSGLWVYDDYRRLVVAKAQPSKSGTICRANRFELAKDLKDTEIEVALPKNHLFGETEVCALIAGMIAEQSDGGDGKLLNNGRANLFYLGSCVVDVRWFADDRGWHVFTWSRDRIRWSAGSRVFSPATAA